MILSQLKRYVCHYFMSFDCSFFTCYESEEETTALYMRRRMIISQQWTRITPPLLYLLLYLILFNLSTLSGL